MYSIYTLKCPISKEVVYVGMTKDVIKRYQQHTRKKTDNPLRDEWMRELKNKSLKPLLEVLESGLNVYEAEQREIFYIKEYNTVFNISRGGLTPPARKGKKLTIEQKIKAFDCSVLKKTVIQKTKSGEFVNEFLGVREACRITGIDHRSIASVAGNKNPKRHNAGGFKWEYKEKE